MSGRIKIKSSFLLDIVEISLILILVVMLILFAFKANKTTLLYLIITLSIIVICYMIGLLRYNYKIYILDGYLFIKEECLKLENTTYKVRCMHVELTDGKSFVVLPKKERILFFLKQFEISEQK